jgi:hypothetical protein
MTTTATSTNTTAVRLVLFFLATRSRRQGNSVGQFELNHGTAANLHGYCTSTMRDRTEEISMRPGGTPRGVSHVSGVSTAI